MSLRADYCKFKALLTETEAAAKEPVVNPSKMQRLNRETQRVFLSLLDQLIAKVETFFEE